MKCRRVSFRLGPLTCARSETCLLFAPRRSLQHGTRGPSRARRRSMHLRAAPQWTRAPLRHHARDHLRAREVRPRALTPVPRYLKTRSWPQQRRLHRPRPYTRRYYSVATGAGTAPSLRADAFTSASIRMPYRIDIAMLTAPLGTKAISNSTLCRSTRRQRGWPPALAKRAAATRPRSFSAQSLAVKAALTGSRT